MNQSKKFWPGVLLLCVGVCLLRSAPAETVLSTFETFTLDGLFSSWASATVVSDATNYSITAAGYGSGFKAFTPNIDATAETNIELTVTLTSTNSPNTQISGPIVSLVDADGTFYNYAWYGQVAGTHVLKASLRQPTFTSGAGSVPGLDLSKLAFFHLQDDPGTYSGQYTIAFNLLRLTGAPALAVISQSFDAASQQFTLTWASRPGMNYTVLFTPDLSSSFSPLMTDIPSSGTNTTTSVTVPGGQAGFLRIVQQ